MQCPRCSEEIDGYANAELKGKHIGSKCSQCDQKLQWHVAEQTMNMTHGTSHLGGEYECPGKELCESYEEGAMVPLF
jgi:hypothetical protein